MNTWKDAINYIDTTVKTWRDSLREETNFIAPKTLDSYPESDREKISWEIDALSFGFCDGRLQPIYSQTTSDGRTVHSYPSFERFSDNAFLYFKERAEQTSNLFLKGRYFSILWNAPKPFKRNDYGERAVDALLLILSDHDLLLHNTWSDSLEVFRSAAWTCSQIKRYRSEEIVQISKNWLSNASQNDKYFRVELIRFMIDCPKIWASSSLGNEHDLLLQIMEEFISKPDSFFGKEVGLLGVQLASKLKGDPRVWYGKIGEVFEAFAQTRLDDETRIVPLGQLQQSLFYYRKAGNQAKVDEISLRYQNLQKELKLTSFQLSIDEKAAKILWKINQRVSEEISNLDSNSIFDFLADNRVVFPHGSSVKEAVQDSQPSFHDFVRRMRFDINNNLEGFDKIEAEKQKEKFFEYYRLYIGIQMLPLLSMIFVKGILKGKINHQTLIKYLAESSWLGQELEETNSAGEVRKYCWLGLLAPAILDFFVQREAELKSSNVFTSYVLSIDSLTLKFEGILRDFARRIGATTLKSGRNGQIREGFTEDLLELDKIKARFSEDDLLFFQYVFTSSGMNFRNDIAHCFVRFPDYHETHFVLVLIAILRFAKYEVTPIK